ncbi:MAG TPA: hypothetical protein VFA87_07500, partial [Rhizomicrobium sp.]|nr:hypothetical protein [Rhizomicrobium sp.]
MRGRHRLGGIGALLVGAAGWLTNPTRAQPAELSFTAAQAASGEAEYKTSCIDCHGAHLDDGEFGGPPLKG